MELKSRRSAEGDTLLICDISNAFGTIMIAPALFAFPFIVFIFADVETFIKVGIVAAIILMNVIIMAVFKWRRPTLALRGMKRQIDFFADTRCTSKSGELPVEQIAKFMVYHDTKPSAITYSFRTVLKNGQEFNAETNPPFGFKDESEINQTVQKLAGYAGVPAFDSKGNELPSLSYNL